MTKGKVKWFSQDKGYGFIRPEDGTSDVFVHVSELERSGYNNLDTDQSVSYEIHTNNKGKQEACNIKLI